MCKVRRIDDRVFFNAFHSGEYTEVVLDYIIQKVNELVEAVNDLQSQIDELKEKL